MTTSDATESRSQIPVPDGVPDEVPKSGSALLHEIFRKEALSACRQGLGSPVKPMGLTAAVLTGFLAVVLIAVIGFLLTAKYARKETVSGQITPVAGAFKIHSQLNGIATQVLVREGQTVKLGEQLFSISVDPVLTNGDTLVASLKAIQSLQRRSLEQAAAARIQQLEMQIQELDAKRNGLQIDVSRLAESRRLLERRRQLQRDDRTAYRKLADKGMVSKVALRTQDDAYLTVLQQISQIDREAGLQASQLSQVEAQTRRLHAEVDLAKSESSALEAQRQERELNFEVQHSGNLIAPIEGVVTSLQVRQGASVNAGQTLAVIIPVATQQQNGSLEVELWAPSRSAGFVRPGAKVRVMYDAFPYQTFGVGHGVVKEVSGTPLPPGEIPFPTDSPEQLFRIRVSLVDGSLDAYGKSWPLVPGMRLSADLILEEQSLFNWILGPLRAAKKRAI